jgi:anti-sigma-K factor RskA
MNRQQLNENAVLRDKLAAEYVLGTLRGGARRRFEQWLAQDETLRRAVRDWEQRMHPLAELAAPVTPPARVWQALENELSLKRRRPSGRVWPVLLDNLNFWRRLGVGSALAAAVLLTVLLTEQTDDPMVPAGPAFFAALAGEQDTQLAALVTGEPGRRIMTVRMLAGPNMQTGQSLELWAVPAQGAPRSLGLLNPAGSTTIALPPGVTPENVPLLAISLEPEGGSPNPAGPSGPIVFKGAWLVVPG